MLLINAVIVATIDANLNVITFDCSHVHIMDTYRCIKCSYVVCSTCNGCK